MRTSGVIFFTVLIMTAANHLAAQTATATDIPSTTTYIDPNSVPVAPIDPAATTPPPTTPPAPVPPTNTTTTIAPTASPTTYPASTLPATSEPIITAVQPTSTYSPVPPYSTADRVLESPPTTREIAPASIVQLSALNQSTRTLDQATLNIEAGVRAVTHLSPIGTPHDSTGNPGPMPTPADMQHAIDLHQAIVDSIVGARQPGNTAGTEPPSDGLSMDNLPPLEARVVSDVVAQNQEVLMQVRSDLQKRGGLGLYTDTDKDGVSDYDEVHIYHSDPRNAYTTPGPFTDGQKILRGINPLEATSTPVSVQSPLTDAPVSTDIFEVDSITSFTLTPSSSAPADTKSNATNSANTAPVSGTGVAFSGRALPNSFITLYIFSTPIVVTVKTDSAGRWSYKLDKELPDGKHELYVAMVDNSGSIVAKSPAISFTKQAEALDYQPLVLPPVSAGDAGQALTMRLLAVGAVAVILLGGVVLVGLGMRREPQPTAL